MYIIMMLVISLNCVCGEPNFEQCINTSYNYCEAEAEYGEHICKYYAYTNNVSMTPEQLVKQLEGCSNTRLQESATCVGAYFEAFQSCVQYYLDHEIKEE